MILPDEEIRINGMRITRTNDLVFHFYDSPNSGGRTVYGDDLITLKHFLLNGEEKGLLNRLESLSREIAIQKSNLKELNELFESSYSELAKFKLAASSFYYYTYEMM